jgi:O-antigen/teichoic acid export membrane protein
MNGVLATMRQRLLRLAGEDAKQRSYWRGVVMLTSGSTASQAVGIVSMLALARIYAPEDFGGYALFFSITGMFTLVATAKYDAAVFIARHTSEATQTAMLAAAISVALGLAILAVTPFSPWLLGGIASHPVTFILLLAAATTSGGLLATTSALATQFGAFGEITIARLIQALVMAGLSIGLGLLHWDATGLMLGFVAGQFALVIYLTVKLGFGAHVRSFTWRAARARGRRHRSFPQYLLASELLSYVGGNLISFVTPPLFGAAALGQYSLGFRLATMPINLIGQSMSSVFRTAISPLQMTPAEIPALYRSTFIRLSAVGLTFTLPLLIAGPQLLSIAFGKKWLIAGFYVQILAPLIFFRFVVGPLTAVAVRAGRLGLDTMLQFLFLITAAAGIGFGYWMHSFTFALVAISLLQSLVYLLYLAIGYRLALQLARSARTS